LEVVAVAQFRVQAGNDVYDRLGLTRALLAVLDLHHMVHHALHVASVLRNGQARALCVVVECSSAHRELGSYRVRAWGRWAGVTGGHALLGSGSNVAKRSERLYDRARCLLREEGRRWFSLCWYGT